MIIIMICGWKDKMYLISLVISIIWLLILSWCESPGAATSQLKHTQSCCQVQSTFFSVLWNLDSKWWVSYCHRFKVCYLPFLLFPGQRKDCFRHRRHVILVSLKKSADLEKAHMDRFLRYFPFLLLFWFSKVLKKTRMESLNMIVFAGFEQTRWTALRCEEDPH